jgi:hypothetical protein
MQADSQPKINLLFLIALLRCPMFKSIFVLALITLPFKALANDNLPTFSGFCAEEDLNIKELNTGEAFYLWITVNTKIA